MFNIRFVHSQMIAMEGLIKPLNYRIDFRKILLSETEDDLGKYRYNACHTLISMSFINRLFF